MSSHNSSPSCGSTESAASSGGGDGDASSVLSSAPSGSSPSTPPPESHTPHAKEQREVVVTYAAYPWTTWRRYFFSQAVDVEEWGRTEHLGVDAVEHSRIVQEMEPLTAALRERIRARDMRGCQAALGAMWDAAVALKMFANHVASVPSGVASAVETFEREWRDVGRAVMLGLCVGDSLGSTAEFLRPTHVERLVTARWPAELVSNRLWKRGEPTDDSDQALAMCESFLAHGCSCDVRDIAERFIAWKRAGPKDIGITTARVLGRIDTAMESERSLYAGALGMWHTRPQALANGSLMRNGAVPAVFGRDAHEALDVTVRTSILTHYAPLCVVACALHTILITDAMNAYVAGHTLPAPTMDTLRSLLTERWHAWRRTTRHDDVVEWLETVGERELRRAELRLLGELDGFAHMDPYTLCYEGKAGYVSLTLKIALWALHWSFPRNTPPPRPGWLPAWMFTDPFRCGYGAIRMVATVGADADTYAAVAGPLLAAYHPRIEERLLRHLRVRKQLTKLFA